MRLSPSRIKNGADGDGYFHADLLFERSAWKIRGKWSARRGWGSIKQVQFGTEAGDQLSGAEAERRFANTPMRQTRQARCRVETKALDGSQKKHGVRSDMKGRLMRDGLFGPNLGLADTQQVFFFLLVDFDFPTIEIGLEDLNHIRGRIGDQQISGLAIETMAMGVIRQRRDDDQAQGSPLSAPTPENRTDGLVTQLMRTTGGKDRGSLPGNGVILTHLFGSPQIFTV